MLKIAIRCRIVSKSDRKNKLFVRISINRCGIITTIFLMCNHIYGMLGRINIEFIDFDIYFIVLKKFSYEFGVSYLINLYFP